MPKVKGEVAGRVLTLLGYDGTDFYNVLVDVNGHLQIDTVTCALPTGMEIETTGELKTSMYAFGFGAWREVVCNLGGNLTVEVNAQVLPEGAATAVNQVLNTDVLELIALLRNALQSVDTDRLKVRGEDQFFSFRVPFHERVYDGSAVAGTNVLKSTEVAAGEVWVLTAMQAMNTVSVCSIIGVGIDTAEGDRTLMRKIEPGIDEGLNWSGWLPMRTGECLRAVFKDCILNDDIYLDAHGFKMTVET